MAIEDTSKLVMLSRAVECSVIEVILFLLDCFKVFGIPQTMKTDKASQLLSLAVKELFESTGIEHVIGVAHYHQSDAVVENGAALIWPYLRIMSAELKKYHAWSPLLCNVQLGANALNRDVLGGACASEIMFGRKIRPLRFLRPEAERPQGGPIQVSRFIADQAAYQLRMLGRADAERHRRYRLNLQAADEDRDGAEHLDWVAVGMLVSIPQPDNDQHFNRPYKFAFLRRGPYEVCDVRGRTVMLKDHQRARAGENPQQFLWPKYNLAPYYQQSDILPPTEPVIHMPFADELEPVPVAVPPQLPSAIVSCRSLPEPVVAGETCPEPGIFCALDRTFSQLQLICAVRHGVVIASISGVCAGITAHGTHSTAAVSGSTCGASQCAVTGASRTRRLTNGGPSSSTASDASILPGIRCAETKCAGTRAATEHSADAAVAGHRTPISFTSASRCSARSAKE